MKMHKYFISILCMVICVALLYGHAFADEVKVDSHLGLKKLELTTSDADIKALMVEMKKVKKYFEDTGVQSTLLFMSASQDAEDKKVLDRLALAKKNAIDYVDNSSTSKVFARYGTFNSEEGLVIIYIHSIESTIFGVNITFRIYVEPPVSSVQLVGFKGNLDILDVFGDSLLKTDIKYSQRCFDVSEFTRSVKAGNKANELAGVTFTNCKYANIATKWGKTLDVIWGKTE